MRRRLICIFLLVSSLSVFAAETENILVLKPDAQHGDVYKPQGFWPLLGLGLGVMDHNDNTRTSGVPGHVKVLGSYYFQNAPVVTDLGVGVNSEFVTQSGPGSNSIQSLYTELAGRYVFTNRWQLGAIWNTLVDNPRRFQSNNDNLATFVGAQALKEFAWNDETVVRVGGRAMTSLGLNGGSVNSLMAELEVSFGGDGAKGHVVAKQVPAAAATPIDDPPASARAIAPHLADEAMRSFEIDVKEVRFTSANSTELTEHSAAYIQRLATSLARHHRLFDGVAVSGLTTRRAIAIQDKFVAAGLNPRQIEVGAANGKNMRLEFSGVKNPDALKHALAALTR